MNWRDALAIVLVLATLYVVLIVPLFSYLGGHL